MFQSMVTSIADAGRELLYGGGKPLLLQNKATMLELCQSLLGQKGEALGTALAREVLDRYQGFADEDKEYFFQTLKNKFEPDPGKLQAAIEAWQNDSSAENRLKLERVVETPRQHLIRALNMAPDGTVALVQMRKDLQRWLKADPSLRVVDADFVHLFKSWFNRGFLHLEQISWDTPAAVLEKLIAYEAVHAISGWDDLRRRLEADRRCYAFFHPALPGDPLIFVEVALTQGLASSVQTLLQDDADGAIERQNSADTAIFYSISNCQAGLKGISFGNFLIKQVAAELKAELPHLKTFSTLSPVPGFFPWRKSKDLDDVDSEAADDSTRKMLMQQCAEYLCKEQKRDLPLDPVARFHLGNGARLERINWMGDTSDRGQAQSGGIMVNYLYDLRSIEANHEALWHDGKVVTSREVKSLL
jgi:malonyl-CoA decarboxylase